MEKMRKPGSMKRAFICAVAATMFLVFAASVLTIYGCYRIQKVILPDSQEVWLNTRTVTADGRVLEGGQRVILDEPAQVGILVPTGVDLTLENTEFIIEKIESGFSALRPKQKFIYRMAGISMVLFPFAYSVTGIMLCAWWFYRKELSPPIQVLADATKHIREQDLDFTVDYNRNDELGRLCTAFEEMRQALYDNNRQLWNMIEQRRILQASVAHDLRNPIAIVRPNEQGMEERKRKQVEESLSYIRKNWKGIRKRIKKEEGILGSSTESHVSHVLSARMSSRPMGWSKQGADKVAQLRIYWKNGGEIRELLHSSGREEEKTEEENKYFSASQMISWERQKHKTYGKYIDRLQASVSQQTMMKVYFQKAITEICG